MTLRPPPARPRRPGRLLTKHQSRVVDYLRTLDHPTKVYPIPGETPVDGGAPDPHDMAGDGGVAPDGGVR